MKSFSVFVSLLAVLYTCSQFANAESSQGVKSASASLNFRIIVPEMVMITGSSVEIEPLSKEKVLKVVIFTNVRKANINGKVFDMAIGENTLKFPYDSVDNKKIFTFYTL